MRELEELARVVGGGLMVPQLVVCPTSASFLLLDHIGEWPTFQHFCCALRLRSFLLLGHTSGRPTDTSALISALRLRRIRFLLLR